MKTFAASPFGLVSALVAPVTELLGYRCLLRYRDIVGVLAFVTVSVGMGSYTLSAADFDSLPAFQQTEIYRKTDQQFFARHPELNGQRLKIDSDLKLRQEYMSLRNQVTAAQSTASKKTEPTKTPASASLDAAAGRGYGDVPLRAKTPSTSASIPVTGGNRQALDARAQALVAEANRLSTEIVNGTSPARQQQIVDRYKQIYAEAMQMQKDYLALGNAGDTPLAAGRLGGAPQMNGTGVQSSSVPGTVSPTGQITPTSSLSTSPREMLRQQADKIRQSNRGFESPDLTGRLGDSNPSTASNGEALSGKAEQPSLDTQKDDVTRINDQFDDIERDLPAKQKSKNLEPNEKTRNEMEWSIKGQVGDLKGEYNRTKDTGKLGVGEVKVGGGKDERSVDIGPIAVKGKSDADSTSLSLEVAPLKPPPLKLPGDIKAEVKGGLGGKLELENNNGKDPFFMKDTWVGGRFWVYLFGKGEVTKEGAGVSLKKKVDVYDSGKVDLRGNARIWVQNPDRLRQIMEEDDAMWRPQTSAPPVAPDKGPNAEQYKREQ